MAVIHGFEDPEVQAKMTKANAAYFDPRIDINFRRAPDRYLHICSTAKREFTISRAPLFSKVVLRGCSAEERWVHCTSVPDPFVQSVHNTENGKRIGELHDGMRVSIDLLNPNNPTLDPNWEPSVELAAMFSSSKNCDLFKQGLFITEREDEDGKPDPTDQEVLAAERKRERFYRGLITQADRLEAVNRKELEEFLQGEDGSDLRIALNYFGEQRSYHKPMIATQFCPNCGEVVKAGAAFHKNESLGIICVIDWKKAIAAGVKNKSDVPDEVLEQWEAEAAAAAEATEAEEAPAPKGRGRGGRR